jgi:hypothetical protein
MTRRVGTRFGCRTKGLELSRPGAWRSPEGRRRYSLARVQSLRLRVAIIGPVSAMYCFM